MRIESKSLAILNKQVLNSELRVAKQPVELQSFPHLVSRATHSKLYAKVRKASGIPAVHPVKWAVYFTHSLLSQPLLECQWMTSEATICERPGKRVMLETPLWGMPACVFRMFYLFGIQIESFIILRDFVISWFLGAGERLQGKPFLPPLFEMALRLHCVGRTVSKSTCLSVMEVGRVSNLL